MSATCKSCSAPIVWAKTPLGKSMPVDEAHSENGNIILVSSKSPPGQVIAIVVKQTERVEGQARHLSHFVTCPNSDKHRKAKS